MAVSIPTIKRLDPSPEMPKNDRINMQVRDQGSAILNQTQQVAGVVNEIGDIYQNFEDNKIEQISNNAEQQYAAWMKGELQKAKDYEGDPTVFYKELDDRAKEKQKEIQASIGDVSDRVSRHVNARFEKSTRNRQLEVDYQRGAQQETYDNNQYESSLKFKRTEMPKKAGYIFTEKGTDFTVFDEGLAEIKNTVVQRGLKKGSVSAEVDAEGKVTRYNMDDAAKLRIVQEQSEAIKSSIDTLISAGKTDEARQMQERYKAYIDPAGAAKLEKQFSKAGVKQEANAFLGSVQGLSVDAQVEKAKQIKDPELQEKVLSRIADRDADLTRLRANREKRNYEAGLKVVMDRMSGPNPYNSFSQWEDEPGNDKLMANMSKKQIQTIREEINSPTSSSPKKLTEVNDLIMNGDITKMSKSEFQLKLNGLSKPDKERALLAFDAFGQQSDSAQRVANKRLNTLIKETMLKQKVIKYNSSNKLTNASHEKLNAASEFFMENMMARGGKINDAEMQKEVNNYVSRIKQDLPPAAIEGRKIPNVFNSPSPSSNVINTPVVKKGFSVYPDGTIKLRDRSAQATAINAYKAAGKTLVQTEPASVEAFKTWLKSDYLR